MKKVLLSLVFISGAVFSSSLCAVDYVSVQVDNKSQIYELAVNIPTANNRRGMEEIIKPGGTRIYTILQSPHALSDKGGYGSVYFTWGQDGVYAYTPSGMTQFVRFELDNKGVLSKFVN